MKTFIRVNEILTDIYLCKVRLILFQGRIFKSHQKSSDIPKGSGTVIFREEQRTKPPSSSQLFLRCARPLWSTTGWTSRRTWRPRTRSPSGSTKSTLKVDRSRLLWWFYISKKIVKVFKEGDNLWERTIDLLVSKRQMEESRGKVFSVYQFLRKDKLHCFAPFSAWSISSDTQINLFNVFRCSRRRSRCKRWRVLRGKQGRQSTESCWKKKRLLIWTDIIAFIVRTSIFSAMSMIDKETFGSMWLKPLTHFQFWAHKKGQNRIKKPALYFWLLFRGCLQVAWYVITLLVSFVRAHELLPDKRSEVGLFASHSPRFPFLSTLSS